MATIQTEALVNGRWTTRQVDVATVLDGQQVPSSRPQPRLRRSDVGILTQTVIESPVSHWLLPVRIWRNANQHLAAIGDFVVKLQILCPDGRLNEIARETDFDSRIQSACIIDVSEVWKSFAIDKRTFINDRDGQDLPKFDPRTFHNNLPPQCIVLGLECGDLVFVLPHGHGPTIKFISSLCPNPSPLMSEPCGRHLAVDPTSRFLAVGCSERHFTIHRLVDEQAVQGQYDSGMTLEPIVSSRSFEVHGVIQKMDFLHAAVEDDEHIILLLLVSRLGTTRLQVFEIDASIGLESVRSTFPKGHPLPPEYALPLLLIPISIRPASFILVLEADMVEVKGVLEGLPCYTAQSIASAPSSRHQGHGIPLWTSWVKPLRTDKYRAQHDDLYIAREDGVVQFVEIDDASDDLMNAQMNAGHLNCTIDTAFACLSGLVDPWEILISSGNSGPGVVYRVEARCCPELLSYASMAPYITGLIAVPLQHNSPPGDAPDTHSRPSACAGAVEARGGDRLFCLSGKGADCSIAEIRLGFKARIRLETDELPGTVLRIWTVAVASTDRQHQDDGCIITLALLDFGPYARAFWFPEEFSTVTELEPSATWLRLEARTIAVYSTPQLLIHITESGIIACAWPSLYRLSSASATSSIEVEKGLHVISAYVYRDSCVLIATIDHAARVVYHVISINTAAVAPTGTGYQPGLALTMTPGCSPPNWIHPSCLHLLGIDELNIIAIIGHSRQAQAEHMTTPSEHSLLIKAIKVDPSKGLGRLIKLIVFLGPENDDRIDDDDACISIADMEVNAIGFRHILLLGYRSGLLRIMSVEATELMEETVLELKPLFSNSLGHIPATVSSCYMNGNMAVALCDDRLYGINCDNLNSAGIDIHRIWVEDDSEHEPKKVSHLAIIPRGLLAVSFGRLYVVEVEDRLGLNARSTIIPSTTSTMLYLDYANILVLAVVEHGSSRLQFRDIENGKFCSKHDTNGSMSLPEISTHTTETVTCLHSWTIRDEEKSMSVQFLVVGTDVGRILLYTYILLENGKYRYKLILKDTLGMPISAIATSGCETQQASIWCCSGKRLQWLRITGSPLALRRHANVQLPSSAVSLSVEQEYVHILTMEHSLVTYHIQDQEMVPYCADEIIREGLAHVALPERPSLSGDGCLWTSSTIILVSDKSCSVAGLRMDDDADRARNPLDYETACEAELPVSVLRMLNANCRTPWSTSHMIGSPYDDDFIMRRSSHEMQEDEVTRLCKYWPPDEIDYLVRKSELSGGVFGNSIDGSLLHIRLISEEAWRLLSFLQDLSKRSDQICPVTWKKPKYNKPDGSPLRRHIDGDLLRKTLGVGSLEALVGQSDEVKSKFDKLAKRFLASAPQNAHKDCRGFASEACVVLIRMFVRSLLRPVL